MKRKTDWKLILGNWAAALTLIVTVGGVIFWSHNKLGDRVDKQENRLDQLYGVIIDMLKDRKV